MTVLPVMIDGATVTALVVGGGPVALRKARSLAESGARVHVVAPAIDARILELESTDAKVRVTSAQYDATQLDGVNFVVAATDLPDVNTVVARDARAKGLLVNVVDAPDLGTCTMPAVHRAGDVVVAVSAGGVPSAAQRIRDDIARIIDERHGRAVAELNELRRAMLDRGDRVRWREASERLVGPDFVADVGSGRFSARLSEWR